MPSATAFLRSLQRLFGQARTLPLLVPILVLAQDQSDSLDTLVADRVAASANFVLGRERSAKQGSLDAILPSALLPIGKSWGINQDVAHEWVSYLERQFKLEGSVLVHRFAGSQSYSCTCSALNHSPDCCCPCKSVCRPCREAVCPSIGRSTCVDLCPCRCIEHDHKKGPFIAVNTLAAKVDPTSRATAGMPIVTVASTASSNAVDNSCRSSLVTGDTGPPTTLQSSASASTSPFPDPSGRAATSTVHSPVKATPPTGVARSGQPSMSASQPSNSPQKCDDEMCANDSSYPQPNSSVQKKCISCGRALHGAGNKCSSCYKTSSVDNLCALLNCTKKRLKSYPYCSTKHYEQHCVKRGITPRRCEVVKTNGLVCRAPLPPGLGNKCSNCTRKKKVRFGN